MVHRRVLLPEGADGLPGPGDRVPARRPTTGADGEGSPSAPEDHLMPVVAMPWMKWRWKKRKTTRIGSTMSVAPASSSP